MNIGLTMIGFNYRNNVLKKTEIKSISVFNSPSWVRTNDPSVNSRMLYHWAIEEYLYSINPFVYFDKGFYLLFYFYIPSKLHTRNIFFILPITLLGHALDRLVSVSSIHYCTSTSDLSTSSSSRGLTTYVGISHLEGGFTLRCLQRLSRPGLATLPCIWYATDTPAASPSRSSRTKDSSSQISYAHAG